MMVEPAFLVILVLVFFFVIFVLVLSNTSSSEPKKSKRGKKNKASKKVNKASSKRKYLKKDKRPTNEIKEGIVEQGGKDEQKSTIKKMNKSKPEEGFSLIKKKGHRNMESLNHKFDVDHSILSDK